MVSKDGLVMYPVSCYYQIFIYFPHIKKVLKNNKPANTVNLRRNRNLSFQERETKIDVIDTDTIHRYVLRILNNFNYELFSDYFPFS